MCGIYGYISRDKIIPDSHTNIKKLFHRGPDSFGSWKSKNKKILLEHSRLSIIDLTENSNQPMSSQSDKYVLIYNGEIYNYIELRNELISLGHHFKSNGDTEVVLKSYMQWGDQCFNKFNGMFALTIYDESNEYKPKIILARDKVGKKPLYYSHNKNIFEFASETKALKCNKSLNYASLDYYLSLGFIPFNLTISNEIYKIKPGHYACFDIDKNTFNEFKYWDLPNKKEEVIQDEELISNKVWNILKESVYLRLRSDVPNGIFLSGGLDSSLITAAASQVSQKKISTFNISVNDSKMDEKKYAEGISKYFATNHYVYRVNKNDFENSLQEMAKYIDEPLGDSSIIPSYLLAKQVSKNVKTILGGDGGDEIFGGYDHYKNAISNYNLLNKVPSKIIKQISKIYKYLPTGFYGRNRIQSFKEGVEKTYIFSSSFFDQSMKENIIKKNNYIDIIEKNIEKLSSLHNTKHKLSENMLKYDFKNYLPDDILFKIDRTSMMNGLEVRNPFLDVNLINFMYKHVDSEFKIKKNNLRIIQKKLADNYLPKIYNPNKQGFSLPINNWITNINLWEYLKSLPEELFNYEEINKMILGTKNGYSNGQRLFSLIILSQTFKNLNINE